MNMNKVNWIIYWIFTTTWRLEEKYEYFFTHIFTTMIYRCLDFKKKKKKKMCLMTVYYVSF